MNANTDECLHSTVMINRVISAQEDRTVYECWQCGGVLIRDGEWFRRPTAPAPSTRLSS